ncbi:MAG TPA: AsmA-like C-terminal region-containing protein, partial [Candidatus Binataceae bacterium]|nr:AsmA-like C-terminal region-containing protein [Candidatus Binataceae bacterium]
ASLRDIRATLDYSAIVHRRGLPLHSLVLDHLDVKFAAMAQFAPSGGVERIATDLDSAAARAHDLLSDISRRIDVNGAIVADQAGPLADNVYISARRRHRRAPQSAWDIRFTSTLELAPLRGVRLAGDIRLAGPRARSISSGRIWFWDLELDKAGVGDLWLSGHSYGSIGYVLNPGAKLNGLATAHVLDAIAGGAKLNRSVRLGAYSFNTAYEATPIRLNISKFSLRSGKSKMMEGSANVAEPFTAARTLTFSAEGLSLELTRLPQWMRAVRGAPSELIAFAQRLRSGTFNVATLALNTPEPIATLTAATLLKELSVESTLARVSYAPVPGSKLPPLDDFNAQIAYSRGLARLTQGTAQVGGSSISNLNVAADLRGAPARIQYRTSATGQIDVGEAYVAAQDLISRYAPALARRIAWIRGRAPFTAGASGSMDSLTVAAPPDYKITAGLGDIQFQIENAPSAIALKSGGLTVRPGAISIDRAQAVMIDQATGAVVLNGVIIPRRGAPLARNFTADLHQIETSKWLPMLISPSQLTARGLLGGRLAANSDPARGPVPTITGALTLGAGTVQPGFLRSPMIVRQAATLKLDGKGVAFDIPDGLLEGAPLRFHAAIPNFDRPSLRIEAKVTRLNFEVMRFIRLPWSPKEPSTRMPLPASGHIEADEGNLAQLAMTAISTDFSHDDKNWRVYNFRAKAFNGEARLGFSGSSLPGNDWINIKGRVDSMDAGPLFMLAESQKKPPVTGTIAASADLWANTDIDFFNTLAGSLRIDIANGRLNRFTLLTRILSFINLKNWLTANFPDPRVAGIPFDTLAGDFKGVRGAFYTENLRLDGPVMNITAAGNIDLADARMDMRIGMIPFNTVSWIIGHIPIIGGNLAGGTKGLIAAYFRVRGPVDNPSILPLPITSVAEFVIKTLGLPINIIRPDTVK